MSDFDEKRELNLEDKKKSFANVNHSKIGAREANAMRRFDSMIAVSDSDSDKVPDDVSDHSAIDGFGKEN